MRDCLNGEAVYRESNCLPDCREGKKMASSCSVQNYKGIYRSHCMCLPFCVCKKWCFDGGLLISEGKILYAEVELLHTEGKILHTEMKILYAEIKILYAEVELLYAEVKILYTEVKIL